MNKEQFIEKYFYVPEFEWESASFTNKVRKEAIQDLKSLIDSKWISVEDELPEEHDWYVCWSGKERYYGFDGSWYHTSAGGSCRVNPTHWKRKSQPPEK